MEIKPPIQQNPSIIAFATVNFIVKVATQFHTPVSLAHKNLVESSSTLKLFIFGLQVNMDDKYGCFSILIKIFFFFFLQGQSPNPGTQTNRVNNKECKHMNLIIKLQALIIDPFLLNNT